MLIKKLAAAAISAVLLLFFGGLRAAADSEQLPQTDSGSFEQGLNDVVEQDLNDAIDDETREDMAQSGIDGSDISGLTLFDIIKSIKNIFVDVIYTPIKVLARLCAVLILTALAKSMSSSGAVTGAFSTVSVLGCITIIYSNVYAAFDSVCGFLDRLSEFMLSYIPIYAALTAASGHYTVGGSYYASTLCVCEIIAFCAKCVIMPFLSVFMALSFTAAANPEMRFSSAAESVKNAVRFILTALMTIFTGLISVQSFSGAAADNAAARAVKFGASNFIPIIGGSVSEAYSTVYASIGVIRSGVGTIGTAAVTVMLLRPLVSILCVKLTLIISRIISDLLGLSETSELLRSTDSAMSAAVSTLLTFALMFIVATAVIMLIR